MSEVLSTKGLVLLALGSNMGDREAFLQQGCLALASSCGEVVAQATPVASRPLGGVADAPFLNTAVLLETGLAPLELLYTLQEIEARYGRRREERWGNRTLDMDIILWRDARGVFITLDHPQLKIPHPAALERDFVLVPASQIAGDWRHPLTHRTLLEESHFLGRTHIFP